jgi:hypothetical protein
MNSPALPVIGTGANGGSWRLNERGADPETGPRLFREKPFDRGVYFCGLAAVGQVPAIAI